MTGYCKYCDTLTDDIVNVYASNPYRLVWSGCLNCHKKRNEELKHERTN